MTSKSFTKTTCAKRRGARAILRLLGLSKSRRKGESECEWCTGVRPVYGLSVLTHAPLSATWGAVSCESLGAKHEQVNSSHPKLIPKSNTNKNANKNLLSVSYLRFSFNEIETLSTNTSMCSCLCFRYTHHIDMIRDLSPEHITRKDIWFAIDMFVMSCYVKHFLFINMSFYLCFC